MKPRLWLKVFPAPTRIEPEITKSVCQRLTHWATGLQIREFKLPDN